MAASARSTSVAAAQWQKSGDDTCDGLRFTKTTLKLMHEAPIVGLLADRRGERRFEASDIISANGNFVVVSDDLWSLAQIDPDLRFNSPRSFLVDPVDPPPPPADPDVHTENGYEAIFYDKDTSTFSGVIEAVATDGKSDKYHAEVDELRLDGQVYVKLRTCPADFEFQDSNLGFEGAIHFRRGKEQLMLGLCESNHCAGGQKARDAGNGRMVVLRREEAPNGSCSYKTVKTVHLPATAAFLDYSAIALSTDQQRVAITAQESSKVWVGDIDMEQLTIPGPGKVYDFPRDNDCHVVYCNIEGITFMEGGLLVAVSDEMKSEGRQDFRCRQKDQSIHVFALP